MLIVLNFSTTFLEQPTAPSMELQMFINVASSFIKDFVYSSVVGRPILASIVQINIERSKL